MGVSGFFEFFRETSDPRLSDILMISGHLSPHYIEKVEEIKKVMHPKLIAAVGDCAGSKGLFKSDLNLRPHIIIEGCPPDRNAVRDGYLQMIKKLK
jgi:Ni,Fe-hydrogenase III small subunit